MTRPTFANITIQVDQPVPNIEKLANLSSNLRRRIVRRQA